MKVLQPQADLAGKHHGRICDTRLDGTCESGSDVAGNVCIAGGNGLTGLCEASVDNRGDESINSKFAGSLYHCKVHLPGSEAKQMTLKNATVECAEINETVTAAAGAIGEGLISTLQVTDCHMAGIQVARVAPFRVGCYSER